MMNVDGFDKPAPIPPPLRKRDMFVLHDLLFRLKIFVQMEYDKADEPPDLEEITYIEEYIERVTKKAP